MQGFFRGLLFLILLLGAPLWFAGYTVFVRGFSAEFYKRTLDGTKAYDQIVRLTVLRLTESTAFGAFGIHTAARGRLRAELTLAGQEIFGRELLQKNVERVLEQTEQWFASEQPHSEFNPVIELADFKRRAGQVFTTRTKKIFDEMPACTPEQKARIQSHPDADVVCLPATLKATAGLVVVPLTRKLVEALPDRLALREELRKREGDGFGQKMEALRRERKLALVSLWRLGILLLVAFLALLFLARESQSRLLGWVGAVLIVPATVVIGFGWLARLLLGVIMRQGDVRAPAEFVTLLLQMATGFLNTTLMPLYGLVALGIVCLVVRQMLARTERERAQLSSVR